MRVLCAQARAERKSSVIREQEGLIGKLEKDIVELSRANQRLESEGERQALRVAELDRDLRETTVQLQRSYVRGWPRRPSRVCGQGCWRAGRSRQPCERLLAPPPRTLAPPPAPSPPAPSPPAPSPPSCSHVCATPLVKPLAALFPISSTAQVLDFSMLA
jgi:hypothetical protein